MVCEMLATTKRYVYTSVYDLAWDYSTAYDDQDLFFLIVYTFITIPLDYDDLLTLRQEIDNNKSKEYKKSVLLLCKIILTFFLNVFIYFTCGTWCILSDHTPWNEIHF